MILRWFVFRKKLYFRVNYLIILTRIFCIRTRSNFELVLDRIRPIELHSKENLESNVVWTTGSGVFNSDENQTPEHLHLGNITIDETGKDCIRFMSFESSKNICLKIWSDSFVCKGDSGSAVFAVVCGYIKQVGIVSYGNNICKRTATVLTRVSYYIDWINGTIEMN